MSSPPPSTRERLRQQGLAELDARLSAVQWPPDQRDDARRILEAWLEEDLTLREALELLPLLVEDLARTADPAMALRNWDRFARVSFNRTALFGMLAANAKLRAFLASLFAFSQFLSDIVIRNPEYLEWCLDDDHAGREKRLDEYRTELHAFVRAFRTDDSRRRALCRFKRREMLRIGVRDLRGLGTTAEHCRELSSLAEAACELAFEDCVAALIERHGRPSPPTDVPSVGNEVPGFAVFAMGKFGGRELNFSSDIDLIFAYDSEGRTSGRADATGHVSGAITSHEFYSKLANGISRMLADPTTEGILYRVDTRLRPDGASGAIARSLPAYTVYFTQQARSWEKISYVKARCVAGNRELAPLFEERCHAFVYAGNTPEELLPEVARLKRRIDTEGLDEAGRRLDIKRGPGGIREIEFFVAALQLLHGARERRLRTRATLEALDVLVELGHVPADDARALAESYWLFRRVEHVLQMMEEQQTHTLPDTSAARKALARRLGFASPEDFEETLARCRAFVRESFESLFHEEGGGKETALADRLRAEGPPTRETLEELRPFGLASVEGISALRDLTIGSGESAIASAGQRRFERLLPILLQELRRAAMPVLAVRNLHHFSRAHSGGSALYDLILAHPPLVRLLVLTLGYGALPSRILAAHPAYFDEMVMGEALAPTRSSARVFDACMAEPLFAPDPEIVLPRLRAFREAEGLYVSVREILGIVSPRDGALQTTELADVCVRAVAELASPDAAAMDNWCVLALGSYGAGEAHLCADLDVAFFFDARETGGDDTRRLHGIASFILSEMSAVAPQGQLWRMDARLRPDGRSAPTMVDIERARRYYAGEAGLWELQSATRARFVAGNPDVGKRTLDVLRDAVAQRGQMKNLAGEVRGMRARMEGAFSLPSHGLFDLKRSPGGLIDIEFLVQFHQLRGAAQDPELLSPDIEAVLDRLAAKWVLDEEEADFTRDHYRTLRTVQRALRLLFETSKDIVPAAEEKRDALVRALGDRFDDPAAVLAGLPSAMRRMRELFDRLLAQD